MTFGLKGPEWKYDDTGRSPAYFSSREHAVVSRALLDELREVSIAAGKLNIRLCVHNNPERELQDMIILEYKDQKCRIPHKHTDSDERIEVLEGKILTLVFDDSGNLLDQTVLCPEENFIYRTPINRHHVYL